LNEEKKQQVVALGRLGWSLRRIERRTGVRRETAATYLKAAGVPLRPPGGWGRHDPKPAIEVITDSAPEEPPGAPAEDAAPAKPAIGVTTGFGAESATDGTAAEDPKPSRRPFASACEPYREVIALGLSRGRNAVAIWQDLVDKLRFRGRIPKCQALRRETSGKPGTGSLPGNRNRSGRRDAGRLR
jgi:hypothetical protein